MGQGEKSMWRTAKMQVGICMCTSMLKRVFAFLRHSTLLLQGHSWRLIESMMGFRSKQGNLRLVFRLFSLMGGLPSLP